MKIESKTELLKEVEKLDKDSQKQFESLAEKVLGTYNYDHVATPLFIEYIRRIRPEALKKNERNKWLRPYFYHY